MEELKLVYAYDRQAEVCEIFQEYTDMLVAEDPEIQKYLSIQNYEQEIADLKWKYGLPEGRLYLADIEGKPVGCVALRKLNETQCELKRLYVRPAFRGKQVGEQLMDRIIQDAKEIGYTEILLDTLPFLKSAIRLYQRKGFYEIPCYNDSPWDTTIYMKFDL